MRIVWMHVVWCADCCEICSTVRYVGSKQFANSGKRVQQKHQTNFVEISFVRSVNNARQKQI